MLRFAPASVCLNGMTTHPYPGGKRAALSLTFDDARLSQVDTGLPILEHFHLKGTFYVILRNVELRLEAWAAAVTAGHEIGNHTLNHPCSGNYPFARAKALEDYTLHRMAEELDETSRRLRELLGVEPRSFAYPCGQDFVGRGAGRASYVPLVAERFLVGRSYLSGPYNLPGVFDPAAAASEGMDNRSWEAIRNCIDAAIEAGGWLILTGHEVAESGDLAVDPAVFRQICAYAREREDELYTGTVAQIGSHLRDRESTD